MATQPTEAEGLEGGVEVPEAVELEVEEGPLVVL